MVQFRFRLDRYGNAQCTNCNRVIAPRHVRMYDEKALCPTCASRHDTCCENMKRYIYPLTTGELYIRHQDGYWAIEVDIEPEGGGHVWETVAITYCPFCGALLEA